MPFIKTIGLLLFWIVVLLTIIFLLFVVVVNGTGLRYKASSERTEILKTETFAKACQLYRINNGEFPNNLDALLEKPEHLTIEQWNGPYLDELPQNDVWGNPYLLEVNESEGRVDIRSLGPDGMPDTADDISSSSTSKSND